MKAVAAASRFRGLLEGHRTAALLASVPALAAFLAGANLLDDLIYLAMPDNLSWALAGLFLLTAFVLGLFVPSALTPFVPAAIYAAVTLLWPLTPWESYRELTYDSGWAGVLLIKVGVPSVIIGVAGFLGYGLGRDGTNESRA